MVKQIMFENVFKKLLEGDQTWKLVPDISIEEISVEYNNISEIYFTNKDAENWTEIANMKNQKSTFLVGKYSTRYYYEEDEYTNEAKYFFGIAKKIDINRINPTTCITISDGNFEPVRILGQYKVIKDLFDKAKNSTFDFQNILDDI